MCRICLDKWFIFYDELEFRKILKHKTSKKLAYQYREEMLCWFHDTPLAQLDLKQSQYFEYLNSIDNSRNIVGGVETSIEKVKHIYGNTFSYLKGNCDYLQFTSQTVSNITGLYLDFKANSMDRTFWFMRLVIYFEVELDDKFCANSDIFRKISTSIATGEHLNLPKENRLNSYDFFGSDICSNIYKELETNNESDTRYRYLSNYFKQDNILGFCGGSRSSDRRGS